MWLQEVRRFKPSTVSRRLSVVICFYRTCVIDAVLEHSSAAYVRRPPVPAESPTLGLAHLQFEAMLVASRTSPTRSSGVRRARQSPCRGLEEILVPMVAQSSAGGPSLTDHEVWFGRAVAMHHRLG